MIERQVLVRNISNILQLFKIKAIEYDKKDTWSIPERKEFVQNIFYGYPIGEIMFVGTMDDDTGKVIYKVINGNKRINAIIDFWKNKFRIEGTEKELSFSNLKKDYPHLERFFYNCEFPLEIIYTEDQEEIQKIIEKQ